MYIVQRRSRTLVRELLSRPIFLANSHTRHDTPTRSYRSQPTRPDCTTHDHAICPVESAIDIDDDDDDSWTLSTRQSPFSCKLWHHRPECAGPQRRPEQTCVGCWKCDCTGNRLGLGLGLGLHARFIALDIATPAHPHHVLGRRSSAYPQLLPPRSAAAYRSPRKSTPLMK